MLANSIFLAPPSPLVATQQDIPDLHMHHTLPHMRISSSQLAAAAVAAAAHHRSSGAQSPPLPPPPPPEDEHEAFGRPQTAAGVMPIVPDEDDLPGWVPKNYIEKGNQWFLNLNIFDFLTCKGVNNFDPMNKNVFFKKDH